jgi:predicted CxxxxCH...CXXCH cytochrome family protein
MGRIIARQIRGMNWWTKGALIGVFTLMCTVFMHQGWYQPFSLKASVGVPGQWTNLGYSTVSTAFTTASYTPAAGNSRIVLVAIAGTNTATVTNTVTASYGGQAVTQIATISGSNRSPIWLGYLTEAKIQAATGSTFSVTVAGGSLTEYAVYANTYTDVSQTATFTSGVNYRTNSFTTAASSISTGGTLTGATAGGCLAYIVDNVNAVAATPVTDTPPAGYVHTASDSRPTGAGYSVNFADKQIASTATEAQQTVNLSASVSRASILTVALNPIATPTGSTTVANLADYNAGNLTQVAQGKQNVGMLSFQLSSNVSGGTTWTGGKLDKIGSNANLGDATFTLYYDADGNGIFNPSTDTKISDEISFSQATGQGYTLTVPQTLSGTAKRYFVAYNVSVVAATGTTVGAAISGNPGYFTTSAGTVNGFIGRSSSTPTIQSAAAAVQKIYAADFNSGTAVLAGNGTTQLATTNSTCATANGTITAGSSYIGLLNFPNHSCTTPLAGRYVASSEANANLITLYFNGAGYATNMTTVAGSSFTFRAGASSFTAPVPTFTVTLFYTKPDGTRVTSGTSSVYAPASAPTGPFTLSLANQSFSNVPAGSQLGLTIGVNKTGCRVGLDSADLTQLVVLETATVNPGVDVSDGSTLTNSNVISADTDKVVDSFTMIAQSAQTVASVTVTGNATTNATNVRAVKIYREGASGVRGALDGTDVLIGSGTFDATGKAVVSIGGEPVTNAIGRYLVAYDMAATAIPGQTVTGIVSAISASQTDLVSDTSSATFTIIPTTTVSNGSDPAGVTTVRPGAGAQLLDGFGLQINGGANDTVTSVTVSLSAGSSAGIAALDIVDADSGVVYGTQNLPTVVNGDDWRVSPSVSLVAKTTPTNCKVRITPKSSVAATLTVSGRVTAITHTQTGNQLALSDTGSGTVVIDGLAPPNPALSAATAGGSNANAGKIDLSWGAVVDSNPSNTGISYTLVRGDAGAPAPADFCATGTVVHTGPQTSYTDSGLSGGASYAYRVCAVDGAGNVSSGSLAASARAKVFSVCNRPPTAVFVGSANSYAAEEGQHAEFTLNITNNDIGECATPTFNVTLVGTPDADNFGDAVLTPAAVSVAPNGSAASVKISIPAGVQARQGSTESFTVKVSAAGYADTSADKTLVATINKFGPMLHSSFSVGTKYDTWGTTSTCQDCHVGNGQPTRNIKLIAESVLTPDGKRRPVVLNRMSSSTSNGGYGFDIRANGSTSSNICEVCHHKTEYHTYSSAVASRGLGHNNGKDCVRCHLHGQGFLATDTSDCSVCHGNPPVAGPGARDGMVRPLTNAMGTAPADWGAHLRHSQLQLTCSACHNNYVTDKMGNKLLEMGYNIRYATYSGFKASSNVVTGGTFTVPANINSFYNWTSHSAGTVIVRDAGQSVPTCTIYCHGWDGSGGTNPTPAWVGGASQAACGTCHNASATTPPVSGSHQKHAASGYFHDPNANNGAGADVFGLGLSCDYCHSAAAYSSASHVNGSVEWDLAKTATVIPNSAGATYNSLRSGATGSLAPSAEFKSCANIYCHSTVQSGANGTGAPTYKSVAWGGRADCGSCHVNMATDAAATGSHARHAQDTAFDCRICHSNGGTYNPANHANGKIDMVFSGYGSNTVYSNHSTVLPGTAYGSCSTSNCHGRATKVWGQNTTITLCEKCHGSQNSTGGFYATSGPGTAPLDNTDTFVGQHDAHIHNAKNGGFAIYTSLSGAKDCSECHFKPNGVYDAGHIDTAGPSEVTFSPTSIANRALLANPNAPLATAVRDANGAMTCSNIWCHGAALDSNNHTGAYANVVQDALDNNVTLSAPAVANWKQPFLNGNPSNDCSQCHGYPPPAPSAAYTHYDVTTSQPFVATDCHSCHSNVNTNGDGFVDRNFHINGSLEKGCSACHGNPPVVAADLVNSNSTPTGALGQDSAGAHNAHQLNPSIQKSCTVCHNGYSPVAMPNAQLQIGFNAYNGQVQSGTFWGYSTLSNGEKYVASSAGTVVRGTNNVTTQNSCAVYCHGGGATGKAALGGGSVANPGWELGYSQVQCGSCHGVNDGATLLGSPTTTSHPKHASQAGLKLTCDLCHGVKINNYHVNGSVEWALNTSDPRIGSAGLYKGAVSGATGTVAPSASFGTCTVYCHSSGQGNGASATVSYAAQVWGPNGTALSCAACHQDMSTAGTGSHTFHSGASNGNYDCNVCHGAGYLKSGVSAATHVDLKINVGFAGAGAGTAYSKYSAAGFAPGKGYYGSCSTSNCHGQGKPVWGVAMYSTVQCQKCHGDQNSAVFYSTSYPTQVTATSDAHVGAHNGHLKGSLNYSAAMGCAVCHTTPASVNAAGHMDGTTQVDFPSGSLARSGGTIPSYTAADGSCVTYCHGAGFATGVKGSKTTPKWSDGAFLSGTPSVAECGSCHAFPPATDDHAGLTQDLAVCHTCHPNVNTDGSFVNKLLHMDGVIQSSVSCTTCHNQTKATYRRQVVGAGGDIDAASVSHHIQNGSNAVNALSCAVCHDQSNHKTYSDGTSVYLKNLSGTSVVYDGTSATGANLATACSGCHNAANAATQPFLDSGDTNNPKDIGWVVGSAAHQAANGCFNCHGNAAAAGTTLSPASNGHSGSTAKMMLKPYNSALTVSDSTNYCYNCHGNTAANGSTHPVKTSFDATYGHNTVKCEDCHNPHNAKVGNHTAGSATMAGVLNGATGKPVTAYSATNWTATNTYGAIATATSEYQVCFKCHADGGSQVGTGTGAGRYTDMGLEFNPNNKSGHPVVATLNASPGRAAAKNINAANMKAPWNVNVGNQTMSCTDCHATDTSGQFGPHGSSVKWMLAGAYKAWPYNSAASNGLSTGTYWTIGNSTAAQTSPNGIFCMNCHKVNASNGIHIALQTSSHSGASWASTRPCVACHIRVPHGGKVSRLLRGGSSDALGRYAPNGNGGDYTTTSASGTFYLSGFTKSTTTTATVRASFKLYGVTSTTATKNAGYGCSTHSGSTGEVW